MVVIINHDMTNAGVAMQEEKPITAEDMLVNTSFILGKLHGGLIFILSSLDSDKSKIIKITKLESELRKEIDKLYYPATTISQ